MKRRSLLALVSALVPAAIMLTCSALALASVLRTAQD